MEEKERNCKVYGMLFFHVAMRAVGVGHGSLSVVYNENKWEGKLYPR